MDDRFNARRGTARESALSILRTSPGGGAGGEQARALGRRGMAAGLGQGRGRGTADDRPLLSGYTRGEAPGTLAAM
jgi:hypothetical protein